VSTIAPSERRRDDRLQCIDCRRVSRDGERGSSAYLTDDEDEPAEAIVYCRQCATHEFGARASSVVQH
jgi:hypothetical protein